MTESLTIPKAMNRLPRFTESNAPVPWCNAWENGTPTPHHFAPGRIADAFQEGMCPWCGGDTGRRDSYLFVGEEQIVNRFSVIPGGHFACTLFMVRLGGFPGLVCLERHEVVNLMADEQDKGRIRLAFCREMPRAVTWWLGGECASFAECETRLVKYQENSIAGLAENVEERSGAEMLMAWAMDRLLSCYLPDTQGLPPTATGGTEGEQQQGKN